MDGRSDIKREGMWRRLGDGYTFIEWQRGLVRGDGEMRCGEMDGGRPQKCVLGALFF